MPDQKPDLNRIKIAWNEPVLLQIGKNGITEGTVREAKRLLKSHRYIKVRLLRSTGDDKHTKRAVFEELCRLSDAKLAGVRGFTAVIYKIRN